ncbi:hypothetical protein HanIR_Chr06g0282041 [Helianthus annuus]|nr:hypothetical protein HanIR_Chr06g0282041 [Helianthus annuus]
MGYGYGFEAKPTHALPSIKLRSLKEGRKLDEEEEWILSENDKLLKELEENKTKDLK